MLSLLFLATTALAAGVITPGIPWFDTQGKLLQAHGGSIIEQDGTYYLIGENKTTSASNPRGNLFNGVSCYTSQDLIHWKYKKDLLSNTDPSPDLAPNRIIERPKVIYNCLTQKYVMWMHVDSSNYGDAKSGVAVSDEICGDYTYIGSARPLGRIARDMTLFKDDDSTAYLVAEDRQEGTHFFKLSDDYLRVDSITGTLSFSFSKALEAPAVIKTKGTYFFFGSKLTGWDTNDNEYATAKSIAGPWTKQGTFAPAGSKTCNSQTTFIFSGPNGKYIYMGDRWNKNKLNETQFIWEPLTIDGSAGKASLTCRKSWNLSEVGF